MSAPALPHLGFKIVSTVLGILTVGRLDSICENQAYTYQRLGHINDNLVNNYNKLSEVNAKLNHK